MRNQSGKIRDGFPNEETEGHNYYRLFPWVVHKECGCSTDDGYCKQQCEAHPPRIPVVACYWAYFSCERLDSDGSVGTSGS